MEDAHPNREIISSHSITAPDMSVALAREACEQRRGQEAGLSTTLPGRAFQLSPGCGDEWGWRVADPRGDGIRSARARQERLYRFAANQAMSRCIRKWRGAIYPLISQQRPGPYRIYPNTEGAECQSL